MEFHPNDDAAVSLMEMRFHIPPDTTSLDADPVTVSLFKPITSQHRQNFPLKILYKRLCYKSYRET
jgi:hypothetical protein